MKRSFALVGCIGAWLLSGTAAWAACASDSDNDGVCDGVDVCAFTIPGAGVNDQGCPPIIPGDQDRDGDVDLTDYAGLSLCQTAPDSDAGAACQTGHTDFDLDFDVDMADYAVFQRCFSGTNQPGDPGCAKHLARMEDGCLHIVGTAASAEVALRLRTGFPAFLDIDVGSNGSAEMSVLRAGFDCIVIDAREGDDVVTIDETNGIFTDTELTTIYGGDGNDRLDGGSGAETFEGGNGADVALMGPGADRFFWNNGDDTDVIDGEDGVDVLQVNGGNAAEGFTVTANGSRVRFDRLNASPFFLDIGTVENLTLNANGGDDTLACTGNLVPLIQITADGGSGEDSLNGSNGSDVLLGGDGDDFADGQQGNDVIVMGAGEDRVQWDPGDGSDIVEGGADHDVFLFNGSNGSEAFVFSANGPRLAFTRNLGNIVLDADDFEQFDLQALGAVDQVTVNDLQGTDLAEVNVSLAALGGGDDAQADTVIVNATNNAETLAVTGNAPGAAVAGLAVVVNITGAGPATDRLTVNGLGGNDTLQAHGLQADVIALTLDGGTGDDTLIGSGGGDQLIGNDNNDTIIGGNGDDTADMGFGDDRFIWNPGDDTDIVEGGDGVDVVEVNGGEGSEDFTVTANGTRVRFDRINPAPFFLDIGTTENLALYARGGNDTLACTGNLAALIQIAADGGAGEDHLLGGNGNDLLFGGEDNDFIDGNQGTDTVFLGAGNDTFQWDPGDGSDTVEGDAGEDTLVFNGSNTNEIFDVSADAGRVRFTRNIGAIVMSVDGVEQFDLQTLGGIDAVTVNNLAGTALTDIAIDLAATGGATGDSTADSIVVNGTQAADTIGISGINGEVLVSGLAADTHITHSEPTLDQLTVNGLGGVDSIIQGPGVPAMIMVTINQ